MELMVKDNINNLWDKILIEENFNRRISSRIYSHRISRKKFRNSKLGMTPVLKRSKMERNVIGN